MGIVVIGRNEGERLIRSLRSIEAGSSPVVYVDSGSSDGSVETGRQMATKVVELDRSLPFTAARARNAGLAGLLELDGSLEVVQFVDGDCALEEGWLDRGRAALAAKPRVAAVCGRLRELKPEASVYARLHQMEWNQEAGETDACGGIAMFRVDALHAVGGFNASMIAGEEPELCHRLRRAGWRIERLDHAMAIHDSGALTFRQWWRRAIRSGHASAEGAALQAEAGMGASVRPLLSMFFWGLLAPVAAVGGVMAAAALGGWVAAIPLAIVFGYVFLFSRIHASRRRLREPHRHAALYAFFCVLGKLPQCLGAARYWLARARGRASAIIEYKSAEGSK